MTTSISKAEIEGTRLNSTWNKRLKRVIDVILSSGVLLLVFPIVYIIVFICIKASTSGPVLFKQRRTGKGGRVFVCYKFRTMYINKDADRVQAVTGDPRITPVGKFLRITSIDELPQFWNVLRGDMSVVGPRPHMLVHTEEYENLIPNYNLRLLVKPGITGWAQINGFRGEITQERMQKRINCDLWYIQNWSLKLDMIIILKTLKVFVGKS